MANNEASDGWRRDYLNALGRDKRGQRIREAPAQILGVDRVLQD
jgi:hypothetical protein